MKKFYSSGPLVWQLSYRKLIRQLMVLSMMLLSVTILHAQERTVTGKIISGEDKEPLPGVTVLVKGSTNGTITDIDGNFAISVKDGDVLVISFVGYKNQEVSVNGRTKIDLSLETDISQLEEVIVVGYGTQKKSDLTGAVASINGETLTSLVTANVDQALAGRIAGVQVTQNTGAPGGAVSIRIRGTSSVSGSSEPLYVIDGIPFNGEGQSIAGFDWAGGANGQNRVNPLASINPADIISIEVLKDASATAIYGSRAANGVVLISTRRGKAGEAKINYSGYYSVQELPRKIDMMNLREYAEFQAQIADQIPGINLNERFLDPSLLGTGTDWQDAVFRTAAINSHQLSVSGGTKELQYALSGGYFSQDGIVIGSGFERYTTRINLDAQVKEWFKVGTSINYASIDEVITLNDGGDGVISQALQQSPSTPVKNLDGTYAGPTEATAQIGSNPVGLALLRNNTLKRERITTNFYADIDLMKGLKLRTEYGFDNNHGLNKAFQPTYEWGIIRNDVSSLRQREENNFFWIWKSYLTYNTNINKHGLNAMIGTEMQESNWNGSEVYKTKFVSNDIQVLNQGENSTVPTSGWLGSSSLASYYSRLNYNYADKYLLTFTMRADGSSKFGPNNRWGFFPSGSFAWRVMNESFMPDSKVLSDLKLRVGYGEVGNQNIPNYAYGSALRTENSQFGTANINQRFSNPNLKWEATRQYNLGVDVSLLGGRMDMTLEFYNKQTRDLLLEVSLPSYIRGDIGAPYANVGKLQNKGVEISLNTVNIDRNKFSWKTDATVTVNRNKILNIDRDYTRNLYWYANFQTVTRTLVGLPVGQFYGYVTDGLFVDSADIASSPVQIDNQDLEGQQNLIHRRDGVWIGDQKFKDLNGDGVINAEDQTIIGDPNPDFTFGFNNTFTYGPVQLSVYLTGSYGGDVLNFSKVRNEEMASIYNNQSSRVVNRARIELIDPVNGSYENIGDVRLTNPDTDIPRFSQTDNNTNDRMSDRWIEDGSYIRIQSVKISYNLPNRWLSKVKMSNMNVYANGQNLFFFTKYTGYDPEIGAFNQDPLMQNIDMGRYPTPRVITVGTNITF